MSWLLPQSMGEYLAAGATERIPTARFDDIEAGDLVCQVHMGLVLQAAVAQTLTVGHDGRTRVWRAADGGTVAWEDEPSNADSHLVIYRTVGAKAAVAAVASEGPGPFKEDVAFDEVREDDTIFAAHESGHIQFKVLSVTGDQIMGHNESFWIEREDAKNLRLTILERPVRDLPAEDGALVEAGGVFYLWQGPLGWLSLAGDGLMSHEDMARRDWKPAKAVLA